MDLRQMLRVYRIVNDPKRSEGSVKVGYKLAGALVALALFGAIGGATLFLSSEAPTPSATFGGADDGDADPPSDADSASDDLVNLTNRPDLPGR